ncbi:hypothetical protein GCM10027321_01330 [Massilia terrae]
MRTLLIMLIWQAYLKRGIAHHPKPRAAGGPNVKRRTEAWSCGAHTGTGIAIQEEAMADNLNDRGQQDRSRINMNETTTAFMVRVLLWGS